MNSAEDVDPPAAGGHDERLLRAFDRVARLGIDLEDDDALGERESAAVRAFAALNLDGERDGAPGHEVIGPPLDVPDTRTDPATPVAPYDVPAERVPPYDVPSAPPYDVPAAPPYDVPAAPPYDVPAASAPPYGFPATPVPAYDVPPHDLPPHAAPHQQSAPPADGPLRPDAVLRNRRFTPRDDEFGPGHDASDGVEVDVPPPPPAAPAPDLASPPDSAHRPPAASAATAATGETTPTEPATAEAAAFEPPARAGDSYLLDVAALGVASGAWLWPWAWPAAVACAVLAGTVVSSVAAHGPSVAALVRRAARRMLSWLRPRSLMGGLIVVARTVLLAVSVPALVCGGWWIITQGLNGAFVAARIGVWVHGGRVAAAVICFVLVVGLGEARERRVALVRRVTAQLGSTAVTVVAGAILVAVLGVVVLGPRGGGGWPSTDDGLGWVPARLQDNVDRVRDDVVSAEVHAATGCLSDHQGLTWRAVYTTGNPLAAADVVRLAADDDTPSPGQLATAAAALHNQLAPWVEAVELEVDGDTVVVLDRGDLPGGRPLVDPDDLVGAASSGGGRLVEGADDFDRAVALSCSAAPLP